VKSLIKLALATAAVAATVMIVASVRAQPAVEERPAEGEPRLEVQITDEMIRHSRIRDVLYFVATAYSFGVLLLILTTGLSAQLRDLASRVTKKPFPMAMVFMALLVAVVAVAEFPLTLYSSFVLPHQFDLTDQSFVSWFGDQLKSLGVGMVLGGVLGALALLAIRETRRWWLTLWLGSIPIILLLVVIHPIFIDPLFNRFEPLRDEQLREKLLTLASRAGIEGSRVYQVDKSKQTKTMNGYVTGIGPTSRIVMWDTLLAKLDEEQILAVMGHEMGHYVLKHIWKGLAFSVGIALIIVLVLQRAHDRGLARWGARWGIGERGDPASLPWLLLVASIVSFLLSPVMSGYSRMIERQADMFALELTHLNVPMATSFVRFAEDSKRDPRPHPFIEFWRYSHPPISKRIPFVLSYKPWEQGEPNRFWRE
jgi:STE24 endopeptidase